MRGKHFIGLQRGLIIVLLCFWGVFHARAQYVFHNDSKVVTIGKSVEYFVDSNREVSIDQVVQEEIQFRRFESNVPNMGLVKYPVWLKVAIKNETSNKVLTLQLAKALLDSVEFFYKPKEGEEYKANKSGEGFPFHDRLIKNHDFVYDLSIEPGKTKTYFLRIESTDKLELPLFLGKKGQIMYTDLTKSIFFGIFFGIIIVMFFYNLFIYFTVKDPTYLYYVIYILVVGLIQGTIEGYTFQFIWPENPFVATRSFYVLTALVNISGLEFVRRFLDTKKSAPILDKVAIGLFVVYSIAILLSIGGSFFLSYKILEGFAGIVSLYMLVTSVKIARKGYRPAKFFIIAWIPLIIGIIVYVLKDVGVLPYNTFTNYSITMGSALEVILLSFALADKINILEGEKRISQADALRVSLENERIIREQNIFLEAKVNERTLELQESNEELAQTLSELQETQSQLIESEKMASLGQLTAGIAHEINNPINFVTSNVNPLKRDIEALIEMVGQMEQFSLSNESVDQKQKKIEELKNDLDYDYLKSEINFLIKGIHEGASRTAEIVKGLRVFSRLDEDDLKKADINEGIDSTLSIVNHLLNENIEIEKNYSGIPMVECYPGKLNQVFLNMMSNAIHAIDSRWNGTKGGKFTISTWNDESNIYVSFKDNGVGMAEEVKRKIFDPFFTTKDVGEGTGLGLSIAYNTIKKHDGSIDTITTLGEGTEFVIALPINHAN